jgi:hypothetical protein
VAEYEWKDDRPDSAVRAELDGLYPERVRLRPTDAAGVREGFALVDALWTPTIAQARALPSERLHERVRGEWSFVETLRHLLFAWEAWMTRMVLGEKVGYHEWAVPPDVMPTTRVELEPVLELRAQRAAGVREYVTALTDEDLSRRVTPWDGVAWPPEQPILYCCQLILREEWWHHYIAVRDLRL